MTKNPIKNALAALGYIIVISVSMYYVGHFAPKQDTVIMPIAFLSLFTLSAAVMAYIFGYEPAQLYFDGKKKQGLDLFLKTVGIFAILTIIAIIASIFYRQ
ncbi:MAG: hypothetical protein U0525_04050 [Patescibacteria group bacterium]